MWNEIVSFDIESGNELVRLDVFNKADLGKDELIGSCSFNLQSLQDQYKHDELFQLELPS